MSLLRTSYRYGVFLEYFKFQISASWSIYMVKLCHEKMLILRCIMLPSQKKNEPPPEYLENPDKKLNSLGIILIL